MMEYLYLFCKTTLDADIGSITVTSVNEFESTSLFLLLLAKKLSYSIFGKYQA